LPLSGWKYAEPITTAAHVVIELLVLLVLVESLCYVYVLLPPITIRHLRGFEGITCTLWVSLCGGRFFKGILYETIAQDHWAAKVFIVDVSGIERARQSGMAMCWLKWLFNRSGYRLNSIRSR
jgi:hypothetical protein